MSVISGISHSSASVDICDCLVGTYEGQLTNGLRHGRGKFVSENDSVYEGNWINDKLNGHCVCAYSNGDKYEGEFIDGKKHGIGTYSYAV